MCNLEKLSKLDVKSLFQRISNNLAVKKQPAGEQGRWAFWPRLLQLLKGDSYFRGSQLTIEAAQPVSQELLSSLPQGLVLGCASQKPDLVSTLKFGCFPIWNYISQAQRDSSQITLCYSPVARNEQVVLANLYPLWWQDTEKFKEWTSFVKMWKFVSCSVTSDSLRPCGL